ncbi:uncharacterized protein SPPG_09209 [Spizellomyces punctatus DAOM BR117]|uniref:Potassium channel domain-containing protein n=1 Tax=Spizellomyces punctatus (strain DAOM BR117) TaxID=645134 RepID=A0A0L0HFL3_SPIPD|nr:uncharacterized protein SPPG_09209 [Spizellomyces punctatus DAOM BR117]KND00276.1 hypothetical protein SPPG_09209 [Spizellomyces punctatus DAOM BR117]|eukprot:XP_016608315.1 hypothetical protein SPPG_09209 [Spizellomyces punctatus DAOM BR117]
MPAHVSLEDLQQQPHRRDAENSSPTHVLTIAERDNVPHASEFRPAGEHIGHIHHRDNDSREDLENRRNLDVHELGLTRRHGGRRDIIDTLDENAQEVKTLHKSPLVKWRRRYLGVIETSYDDIRESYRIQRTQERENPHRPHFLLEGLFSLFIAKESHEYLIRFLQTNDRLVLFILLDLVVDVCFCIMYLVELQWNLGSSSEISHLKPAWLYVARPPAIFYTCFAFSVYILASLFTKILFADSKRQALLNYRTALDLILCVPFVVLANVPDNGKLIYIPYFFRAIIVISRVKSVLRLHGTWPVLNVDTYTDRLIVLISTIMVLLYVALCAFQYCENRFAPNEESRNISLMQALYFIVITTSTVGYGDISPTSIPGQIVVLVLIMLAISILPGLIARTVETFKLRSAGGGTYQRGSHPFVVIVGLFDNALKVMDVLNAFLHRDPAQQMKIVFLARTPPSLAVKAVLSQSPFQHRVSYLQGSALDVEDMKRVQIQYASAAFIIADRSASDPSVEDDHNTLRAWAFDDYAPLTPLYVYNLLPETESFQEHTTNAAVCVEDLKQMLLGYSCLYRGASSLLLNLLQQTAPMSQYDEPWKAQYGDGCGNEYYSTAVNSAFVGKRFTDVSWYIFHQYQVILFAVKVVIKSRGDYHLMLNPGSSYLLGQFDQCLYIAQRQEDVSAIETLTPSQYERSLRNLQSRASEFRMQPGIVRRGTFTATRVQDCSTAAGFPMIGNGQLRIGTPHPPFSDIKGIVSIQFFFLLSCPPSAFYIISRNMMPMSIFVPVGICLLLRNPMTSPDECLIEDASTMRKHLLVCSNDYALFRLMCTLRSAHLTEDEFKTVLLLCPHLPSREQFRALSEFPDLHIMIGDPRRKADLQRAGIVGAEKVLIVSMHRKNQDADQSQDETFADSAAIMVSHMIHNLFRRTGHRKFVVVELLKRGHIKFLPPTAKRASKKKHRLKDAQRKSVAYQSDAGVDSYLYAPIYASGRVVAASMLDAILFETFYNSAVLDVFRLLCGVRYKHDVDMDKLLGVDPSYLCCVPVPSEYEHQPFSVLYREFALNQGVIPIALLRDTDDPKLGNRLPFVFTNPLPSIILKSSDLVYVLTPVSKKKI